MLATFVAEVELRHGGPLVRDPATDQSRHGAVIGIAKLSHEVEGRLRQFVAA